MSRLRAFFTISLLVTILSFAFVAHTTVYAEDVLTKVCQDNPNAAVCVENNDPADPGNNRIYGPNGVVTKATNMVAFIVGIAAVIMIIVGGFEYVTASGDPQRIATAKNTIIFALIGVVVVLVARSLILFVVRRI